MLQKKHASELKMIPSLYNCHPFFPKVLLLLQTQQQDNWKMLFKINYKFILVFLAENFQLENITESNKTLLKLSQMAYFSLCEYAFLTE